jgi:hypothetical protein
VVNPQKALLPLKQQHDAFSMSASDVGKDSTAVQPPLLPLGPLPQVMMALQGVTKVNLAADYVRKW